MRALDGARGFCGVEGVVVSLRDVPGLQAYELWSGEAKAYDGVAHGDVEDDVEGGVADVV